MRSALSVLLVFGVLIAAPRLSSQTPSKEQPSFEVVSIKPSAPGAHQGIAIQPGGRFVADGVSLGLLIAVAYHLQAFQMSGVEGWIMNDQWSVEAKDEDVPIIPAWTPPYIPEVMAVRLQALLEDRFALKTHHETRDLDVYTLSVSKEGARLKAVDPPPPPGQATALAPRPPQPGPDGKLPANFAPPPGAILAGPGAIIASAITMDQLVNLLGRLMDRPVIDKTGFTGHFDVRLQFAPESSPRAAVGAVPADGTSPAPPSGDPSIFTAIREQLGLSLDAAREPVEVLVVDSAQRPSAN